MNNKIKTEHEELIEVLIQIRDRIHELTETLKGIKLK